MQTLAIKAIESDVSGGEIVRDALLKNIVHEDADFLAAARGYLTSVEVADYRLLESAAAPEALP